MILLPFLLAALAFVTVLAIITPLLRGSRPGLDPASFDKAVYRDQLQELDRDIARGLVLPEDAATARLEIQRRLLAADRLAETAKPARSARSPVLAGIVFATAVAGSVALYLGIGAPGLPDAPFSAQEASAAAAQEKARQGMQQAVDQIAAKLKTDPSDAQTWLLYARTLSLLARWDQASDAFRHAIALGQGGADILASYGETLVLGAGGTVTPAAATAFNQTLGSDPDNPTARYYLAIAADQAGEPAQAVVKLQALLADLPADSPLRPQIGARVAEAAQAAHMPMPALPTGRPSTGPNPNDVASAAAMSDADRRTMVNGMVERLAASQAQHPDDLDGWLRLGRAYTVLHQTDKAADAYGKAAALKPGDMTIPLQEIRALLADRKPTDKLPPRVVDLLKRVEATDPHEPMVLWYLGIAAAQDGRNDEARRYWGTLLSTLPPAGEDARLVQAALDTLNKPDGKTGG